MKVETHFAGKELKSFYFSGPLSNHKNKEKSKYKFDSERGFHEYFVF